MFLCEKPDVVESGRKIGQNQNADFYNQGKDGSIQNKEDHGNDPHPTER